MSSGSNKGNIAYSKAQNCTDMTCKTIIEKKTVNENSLILGKIDFVLQEIEKQNFSLIVMCVVEGRIKLGIEK